MKDYVVRLRIFLRTVQGVRRWKREKRFILPDNDISYVAEYIGISSYQLSNYIIKRYGMPFLQWRKTLRIKEACRILSRKNPPSSAQAGRMVGINDKTNFRVQFRSVTGMSPTEWMNSH